MQLVESTNVVKLHEDMCNRFNTRELLLLGLHLDFEIASQSKIPRSVIARRLIEHMDTNQRLFELEAIVANASKGWLYDTKHNRYIQMGDESSYDSIHRSENKLSYDNIRPPKLAEYLLWYLPIDEKAREAMIGDLEEEFFFLCDYFSQRKATIWYYYQVSASFWPIIGNGIQKIFKLGILGWVGNIIRHIIP